MENRTDEIKQEIKSFKNEILQLKEKFEEFLKLLPLLVRENVRLSLNDYYLCFKEKIF